MDDNTQAQMRQVGIRFSKAAERATRAFEAFTEAWRHADKDPG